MDQFQIFDNLSNAADLEQLGTKEKFWFPYPAKEHEKWLFKYSRENTGEHWSEKVAEQICELLGIPHVEYELALCHGRFGVITKNIVPDTSVMVMGNEVLYRFDPDNYPAPDSNKVHIKEHTIERIVQCFNKANVLPPAGNSNLPDLDAVDVFCGYLMLDALISNQDRHHENWAILINEESGVRTLCPTYDHAASLGRELLNEDREKKLKTKDNNQKVDAFVRRARSEFFRLETATKPLTTMDAFLCATEGRAAAKRHWLGALEKTSMEKITAIFARIPSDFITESAKEFAIAMIVENRKRLLENGNE
jgi:hypothetical protein